MYDRDSDFISNKTHVVYIESFQAYATNKHLCTIEIQQHNITFDINITITQLCLSSMCTILMNFIECSGHTSTKITNCSFFGNATNPINMQKQCYINMTQLLLLGSPNSYRSFDTRWMISHFQKSNDKRSAKNKVQIVNCQFINISKVKVLLYFKVDGNYTFLSIQNSKFYNNKNAMAVFAQANYSQYHMGLSILVNNTVISSNIYTPYYRTADIIRITGVKLTFENTRVVFNVMCFPQHYGLVGAAPGVVTFYGYNEIVENVFEYAIKSPVIYIQENTVLNITSNIFLHAFFSSNTWMSDHIKTCFVQYTSKRGNLDGEIKMRQKLNYSIMYNKNSQPIVDSNSLNHCSWVSNSAFLAIPPSTVNQQFIQYNPPLYTGKKYVYVMNTKFIIAQMNK